MSDYLKKIRAPNDKKIFEFEPVFSYILLLANTLINDTRSDLARRRSEKLGAKGENTWNV